MIMAALQKNHKPVNICCPSSEHVARVRYGQKLRLLLPPPEKVGLPAGGEWQLELTGHFLSIEEDGSATCNSKYSKRRNDKTVYREVVINCEHIEEKWSMFSNVFLGNVFISLNVPNVEGNQYIPNTSVIFVYLDCLDQSRKNVVTVIDPDYNKFHAVQSIVMEPSQILHIVTLDQPEQVRRWNSYCFPVDGNLQTNLIQKHEQYIAPDDQCYGYLDKTSSFHSSRLVTSTSGNVNCNFGERHLFFQFQRPPSELLTVFKYGVGPAAKIALLGKLNKTINGASNVVERRLDVNLKVRGCVVNREEQQTTAPVAKENPPNPFDRRLQNGMLTNPNVSDRMTLTHPLDSFIVEIVNPIDFLEQSTGLIADWDLFVESVHVKNKYSSFIQVKQLSNIWAGQVRRQRWKISLDTNNVLPNEVILGKLIISCDKLKDLTGCNNRTINVLYRFKSSTRTVKVDDDTYKVTTPPAISSSKYSDTSKANKASKIYKNHSGNKNKNDSYISYFDITIRDLGDNLIAGETYYQHAAKSLAYDVQPPWQDQDDEYSVNQEFNSILHNEGHPDFKKKSPSTASTLRGSVKGLSNKRERKPNKGKNSIRSWNQQRLVGRGVHDQIKESDVKNNTLTVDSSPPNVLFFPQTHQTVTLQRGQPLIINELLPLQSKGAAIDVRVPCAVNIVNNLLSEGFTLWIEKSTIQKMDNGVPYQEIVILPLTPKGNLKADVYRLGAIRLQIGDQVKHITVDLDVGYDDEREPARWWLDYLKSLRKTKPVETGLAYDHYCCETLNRTTLIDPVGKTIDIPVYDTHEIEIVLNEPYYQQDNVDAEWEVIPHISDCGVIDVLDYSKYRLWNSNKIARVLLKVSRKSEHLFGEIKINWDGEDTHTRIRPYGVESPLQNSELVSNHITKDRGKAQVIIDPVKDNHVLIEDWQNEQSLTISPDNWTHIAVPTFADYLQPQFQSAASRSHWTISLDEVALDKELWDNLNIDIRSEIDRLVPYYGNAYCFHPSDVPWDTKHLILPPISKNQPYIYDILEALRKNRPSTAYPLAVLMFSYEVDNRFCLTQKLNLKLEDPTFIASEIIQSKSPFNMHNPKDGTTIVLRKDEYLSIKFDWTGGVNAIMFDRGSAGWTCTHSPYNLLRVNYLDNEIQQQEEFNFKAVLFDGDICNRGLLKFSSGPLQRSIKIVTVDQNAMYSKLDALMDMISNDGDSCRAINEYQKTFQIHNPDVAARYIDKIENLVNQFYDLRKHSTITDLVPI